MNSVALLLNSTNTNISEEIFNFNLGLSSLGYTINVFQDEMPPQTEKVYDYVFIDQLAFSCHGLEKAIDMTNDSRWKDSGIFLIVSKPLSKSEKNIVSQFRIKTITKPILPVSLLRKFRGLERQ